MLRNFAPKHRAGDAAKSAKSHLWIRPVQFVPPVAVLVTARALQKPHVHVLPFDYRNIGVVTRT
jgi:hypothetical protein